MDEVTQAINHFSVLMEDQNAKLDAVHEAVGDMQKKVAVLPRIEQDVAELKQDMKVVKAAVTATNHNLKTHKSLPAHAAHGHV
jgi:peptidoglycan hydrolase CwlO-like protein